MKKAIRNAAGLLLLGGLWVAQAAQAGSISVITNTTDAGAPSDFGFTLFTPIPVLTGLVSWSADVSGTLIDGGRDGVSLAPFGPSIYQFIIKVRYFRSFVFLELQDIEFGNNIVGNNFRLYRQVMLHFYFGKEHRCLQLFALVGIIRIRDVKMLLRPCQRYIKQAA